MITQKAAELAKMFVALGAPFTALIDKIASSISFLFQKTFWIEKIYNVFKNIDIESKVLGVAKAFIYLFTVLEENMKSVFKLLHTIHAEPLKLFSAKFFKDFGMDWLKNVRERADKRVGGFEKYLESKLKKAEKEPPPTYVNNGPITIRNQFPENMEPDRIAVAIKDLFLKSEQARVDTAKRMQTFTPATASGHVSGG